MDNTDFDTCGFDMKDIELEYLEYLATGGTTAEELLKLFPQYSKKEIDKIVHRVACYCWYNDDEWEDVKE